VTYCVPVSLGLRGARKRQHHRRNGRALPRPSTAHSFGSTKPILTAGCALFVPPLRLQIWLNHAVCGSSRRGISVSLGAVEGACACAWDSLGLLKGPRGCECASTPATRAIGNAIGATVAPFRALDCALFWLNQADSHRRLRPFAPPLRLQIWLNHAVCGSSRRGISVSLGAVERACAFFLLPDSLGLRRGPTGSRHVSPSAARRSSPHARPWRSDVRDSELEVETRPSTSSRPSARY
jgi:hypothetical protein